MSRKGLVTKRILGCCTVPCGTIPAWSRHTITSSTCGRTASKQRFNILTSGRYTGIIALTVSCSRLRSLALAQLATSSGSILWQGGISRLIRHRFSWQFKQSSLGVTVTKSRWSDKCCSGLLDWPMATIGTPKAAPICNGPVSTLINKSATAK